MDVEGWRKEGKMLLNRLKVKVGVGTGTVCHSISTQELGLGYKIELAVKVSRAECIQSQLLSRVKFLAVKQ